MSVSQTNKNLILGRLLKQNSVRAVLWIDALGRIKDRRGVAFCLRNSSSDKVQAAPPSSLQPRATGEAVYVRTFSESDFLIIVFDEGTDFDMLKQRIDAIVDGRI